MRILVVEDNASLAETLRKGLEEEGYQVDVAMDGDAALAAVAAAEHDLLVLDRMLPGRSGDDVCRTLRGEGRDVPILMLTAWAAVGDRVHGLDLGADDYVTKPFAFSELVARVRALLRRGRTQRPAVLQVGNLALDPAAHRVTRDGEPVSLTAREFALLEVLMRNAGTVLSREQILRSVWGQDQPVGSNVVEVYINYLRRKVDSGPGPHRIQNVRGVGYVLREGT